MTDVLLPTSAAHRNAQPWLSSSRWDCAWIIAPAFIPALLVLMCKPWMEGLSRFPLWAWVSLVLLVDVGHVYATLYRTYLNKESFARNKTLLVTIPLACWAVGAMLYSMDAIFFWRALAYLAVFHFIRQQYGFIAIYSRQDLAPFKRFRRLDEIAVYAATIYPLLYWHTHLPRAFNWFVDGDFAHLPAFLADIGLVLYAIIAVAYVTKEAVLFRSTGQFNVPRNLLLGGTALSWWVGIVSLNSDLAFTMTNVLAHGIPYMALVWLYHREDPEARQPALVNYLPLFLGLLALLAYLEEGLWDGMVWREHLQIFPVFSALPQLSDPLLLAVMIPLLALPQSTHYVLDGFIWRIKLLKSKA